MSRRRKLPVLFLCLQGGDNRVNSSFMLVYMKEVAFVLDWKKAKTEYITTNISYRKLADKYGTSASAICQKAKAEKWVEQRKQYINKTVTKTVEKISEKEADALAEHYRANDLMAKLLVQILEDDELRAIYLHGGRDLKDYMSALNSSEMMKRREKNILTMVEAERLAMEKKRLEIEEARAKAANGDEDDEDTGVVILAPVDERVDSDGDDED